MLLFVFLSESVGATALTKPCQQDSFIQDSWKIIVESASFNNLVKSLEKIFPLVRK